MNGIKGLEGEFLKGINIHAPESRDYCLELIHFLRKTPVEWVRIHPLPTRRLHLKGPSGISHLDSIEKFAEAGFDLIIPIDVGVKENVGVITVPNLRRFVDSSYNESFKAVKQIETRISKYNAKVIYGIENEIDTKEWILQSMPTVGWRESSFAWIELSVNKDLKFKRLNHILEGIKEASPNALTMVNFEADDPVEDWNTMMSFMLAGQTVFSKLGLIEKDARIRMNNYRIDVDEATKRLSFDIIGMDKYPNYFTKIPPRGTKIGVKANQIAHMTRKPVINIEFGYTREGRGTKPTSLFRSPSPQSLASPEEHQRKFFENSLTSIENSVSQGTFPWVLLLDPARGYKPREENGFTLLKIGSNRMLEPTPALDYYINWLDAINTRELESQVPIEDRLAKDIGSIESGLDLSRESGRSQ